MTIKIGLWITAIVLAGIAILAFAHESNAGGVVASVASSSLIAALAGRKKIAIPAPVVADPAKTAEIARAEKKLSEPIDVSQQAVEDFLKRNEDT